MMYRMLGWDVCYWNSTKRKSHQFIFLDDNNNDDSKRLVLGYHEFEIFDASFIPAFGPLCQKGLVPLEERIVYDSMESNKILGLGDL